MIEYQPAFRREEGHGACSYLGALPGAFGERSDFHHAAMLAPVLHVRAIADVDVAERSMSVVAGAAQHGISPAYLLGEEDAVAVEGQKGVFALEEFLEVERIADADGGAVVAVAPGNPIAVVNPGDARVVFIFGLYHLGISGLEADRLVGDVPVDAIFTKTGEDIHLHRAVVAPEDSGKAFAKGNDGAVEDAV